MTINIIHFENGYVLDPSQDIESQRDRAIIENMHKLENLPEGEYDLTPKSWKNPKYEHNLVVFGNGNGNIRMFPKHQNSGYVRISTGNRTTGIGGHVTSIPGEVGSAIVAGGMEPSGIGIFEIVIYTPGPSPQTRK